MSKEQLREALKNPHLAVTGRITNYLNDTGKNLLPVSCTTLKVYDTLVDAEEHGCSFYETIAGSWVFIAQALKAGAGVSVDLSDLRAAGSVTGLSGQASGPVSFMQVYSTITETMKRGGDYTGGAASVFLDSTHPDFETYIDFPASKIPWLKRSAYVDEHLLGKPELLEKLLAKVADGTIWLAKKRYNQDEERLYSNLCLETLLKSQGICSIAHVNLGMIEALDDLPSAYVAGAKFLSQLFWETEYPDFYLDNTEDPQVGLGDCGLANLLVNFNVTYEELADALELVIQCEADTEPADWCTAVHIACRMYEGYQAAADEFEEEGFDRGFLIAPCASVSYRHKDLNGYTLCPEISPPICHPETKRTTRENDNESITYQYPPTVEVAGHDVSFETYTRVANCFQQMQDMRGLGHSISFNLWSGECDFSRDWFIEWLDSDLVTTYYVMNTDQTAQDKTSIGMDVTAEEEDFWSIADDEAYTCSLTEGCVNCAE